MQKKMNGAFYEQDAVVLAKALLGKVLCRKIDGKPEPIRLRITETEAYMDNDSACYGVLRNSNTEVLFSKGGCAFVYGGMFMVVAGPEEKPQNVLIRSVDGISGPIKVANFFQIDKSLSGEDLTSDAIWIEDDGVIVDEQSIRVLCRKGLSESDDIKPEDRCKPWRFILN